MNPTDYVLDVEGLVIARIVEITESYESSRIHLPGQRHQAVTINLVGQEFPYLVIGQSNERGEVTVKIEVDPDDVHPRPWARLSPYFGRAAVADLAAGLLLGYVIS